jgi:prepilin-type N-terminal cleavage/methylation domain-containing protein
MSIAMRKGRRGFERPRGHAFTLIELLVVVAIMSILMAMLLPALGKAKESAKGSACANSQSQLLAMAQSYAADYNGNLLVYASGAGSWNTLLLSLGYAKEASFPLCASAAPFKYKASLGSSAYGVCMWPNSYTGYVKSPFWLDFANGAYNIKTYSSQAPSAQLFFADSVCRLSSLPLYYGKQYSVLWNIGNCFDSSSQACPQTRHGGFAKTVYADGHGESVGLRDFRSFTKSSYLVWDAKGNEFTIP